ncbi:hypothetical protein AYK59_18450 [Pseudomonas synxantha]|uniref:DUF2569 domain-containing protein n=1 Tax=Pseudomonas libanensis TaxID=75588 RepID=A0ABR5M8A4_9PSED|nr:MULTISPECIES: DUF2569 domain-containing protein [Pseudomonas]AMS22019.1 hypothetical protein AYK59_18450 [Pseudomonas synxantha]KPG75142.1 hypothetical protein AEQ48_11150 [Pseudomonas libanensis]KRA06344.1 hypothetical protein ASD70_15750 [Pseudomonas sp. Root569]MDT3229786.1 DUF2569 domain-containing protein [Pseudomonas sp. rhizo25]
MNEKNQLNGLQGWLLLVMIGLFLSPLRIAYELFPSYYHFFTTPGAIEYISTPGAGEYHPYLLTFMMSEISFNILMVIAQVYLIYLFFSKHYLFPKLYITVVIVSFVFVISDAWIGSLVYPKISMFNPETNKEITRSLCAILILVPYMLISKRVKATFIEGKKS